MLGPPMFGWMPHPSNEMAVGKEHHPFGKVHLSAHLALTN